MEITSRSNPLIVEAAKLKNKKYRDEYGLFAFEGFNLFREAVRRGVGLKSVFLTKDAALRLQGETDGIGCDVFCVTDPVYQKLTDDRSPDGVFCTAEQITGLHTRSAGDPGTAMILCDVQDAGNLGTCMRTALAMGINTLILAGSCADVYNPKTVRSAMGAAFAQRTMQIDDPSEALALCRRHGKKVYAAALRRDAVSLDRLQATINTVFAVGNEGHGLSQDFIDSCDGCVTIPMQGDTESLNVSTASAILMWETYRALNK